MLQKQILQIANLRFRMYELREREPAPVDYGVTFAIGQPS